MTTNSDNTPKCFKHFSGALVGQVLSTEASQRLVDLEDSGTPAWCLSASARQRSSAYVCKNRKWFVSGRYQPETSQKHSTSRNSTIYFSSKDGLQLKFQSFRAACISFIYRAVTFVNDSSINLDESKFWSGSKIHHRLSPLGFPDQKKLLHAISHRMIYLDLKKNQISPVSSPGELSP